MKTKIYFICGIRDNKIAGHYGCSVFKVNKTKKRLTFIQKNTDWKVVFKYNIKK